MFRPALAVALLAAAPAPHVATGIFEPNVTPLAGADDVLVVTKTYHGGAEGSGAGKMVGAGDPASGTAAYVAAETFTGTLDGRRGGFVLLHRGWMHAGRQELSATIAPGSGTGALAGIAGTLTITIAGKEHRYALRYTLPAR